MPLIVMEAISGRKTIQEIAADHAYRIAWIGSHREVRSVIASIKLSTTVVHIFPPTTQPMDSG
jgi:hypothetical protein